MPANFTIPLITVIPGQTITAALWNNEYENIDTNFTPAGMDDYSTNDAEMQVATDPFPSGATSRPTSLQGEIERLRYQLANILGETYWYNDPDATIAALNTRVTALEGVLTAATGTKMVFYQAAAPTGWTAEAINDKFLRVVTAGGTGGTTGGSGLTPSSTITLAHSHTVASHTHSLSVSGTTSSDGAHTHSVPKSDWSTSSSATSGELVVTTAGGQTTALTDNTTGSGGSHTHTVSSSGTSGSATPGTDSQLSNTAFQYADVIVASKN